MNRIIPDFMMHKLPLLLFTIACLISNLSNAQISAPTFHNVQNGSIHKDSIILDPLIEIDSTLHSCFVHYTLNVNDHIMETKGYNSRIPDSILKQVINSKSGILWIQVYGNLRSGDRIKLPEIKIKYDSE